VAISNALPLPTFLTAWTAPSGMNSASPALSVAGVGQHMDMVFLYRRPILEYWCETGEDLKHVIRHVLIHEIGHHFGLSDEDMERIEEEAE
jgi:predicted Zn-dependent protease with MMP-like domain